MSDFINQDGSALIGGQKPGGQGQALQVDATGNLLVNVAIDHAAPQFASSDGFTAPTVPIESMALYSAGGPPLANGIPSQLSFDRQRSFQSKGQTQNVAITSGGTTGSTTLVLAAVTGLVPGAAILLTGGSAPEVVFVANTYAIGSVYVPLQNGVASSATQTAATWDAWSLYGPAGNAILPFGLPLTTIAVQDQSSPANINIPTSATADAVTPPKVLEAAVGLYNGVTVDRARGNSDTGALITAAGVTTAQTSTDQTNYNARGIKIVLNVTALSGGSLVIALQGKDAASGVYWTLLASVAITTPGVSTLTLYPGIAPTANIAASDILTRTWRVQVTPSGSTASYTVGASIIL